MATAALVLAVVVVAAAALVTRAVTAAAAAVVAIRLELAHVKAAPVEASRRGIGLLGVQQANGLGTEALTADLAEHVVEREGRLGTGQRDLEVLGLLDGKAQVLAEVLDEEARLVVARERLGAKARERAGAAHAGAHHVEHARGVKAALLREGEGVCHAHHAAGERHLVAELGRLALAGAVEVAHLGRERLEHGQDGGGVGLGAAEDERERAVDGTLLATGHGAVDGVLVLDLGRVVDVAGELGRGSREVNEPGTGLGRTDQAVGGQVDVLDVGGVAKHREHDVGVAGGISRAARPRGAMCDEAVCLGLGAVVDRELVAGVHDVAGDGRSHDAGADERDLGLGGCGHVVPFYACCRHGRLSRGGRPSLWVLAVTCLRGRGARCGP